MTISYRYGRNIYLNMTNSLNSVGMENNQQVSQLMHVLREELQGFTRRCGFPVVG